MIRQALGDLLGRGHHVTQVRVTVAAPCWCAHRDEDRLRPRDGGSQIGGEGQPPRLDVLFHEPVEPRLEDRDLAAFQAGDLVGVLVHADDIMPEVGKAHPRHKPHVAGADHRDFHGSTIP